MKNINQTVSDKLLVMLNILNSIDASTDKDDIANACEENNLSTQDFYAIYNAVKETCAEK